MKIKDLIEVLEKMKDQKVVAVTDAQEALGEAIKRLRVGLGTCDVCWTSSWAPAPKDYPNAQKIKGKEEYVICQMCEAERMIMSYRETKK